MIEKSGEEIIEELRHRLEKFGLSFSEELDQKREPNFPTKSSSHFQENIIGPNIKNQTFFNHMKRPNLTNLSEEINNKSINLFHIKSHIGENLINHSKHQLLTAETEMKEEKHNAMNKNQRILQMDIWRLKAGQSKLLENLEITLERSEKTPSILILKTRQKQTNSIIYESELLKNISKPEHFMNKEDNLKLTVIKKHKTYQPEKEIHKEIIKIQFYNILECKSFQNIIYSEFEEKNI